MTPQEKAERARELGPWFYPYDFGDGVRAESYTPPEVAGIFETRREMAERAVRGYSGGNGGFESPPLAGQPPDIWTNLNNGQSTTVTINDRGPYVGGRVIDLSSAAAGAVGMKGAGLARVKLDELKRRTAR